MINKNLDAFFPKKEVEIGNVVLSVRNLTRGNKVKNVSFDLRKGEIFGLTGLLGAGRTEIARCIFGIDEYEQGEIILNGKKVSFKTPKQAAKAGLALVPEDRKLFGLVLRMNICENI